ncbi:hypothetical protein [Oceanobacillus salinisoli]|uniref:hypothetical protein n=1 Tax=Oceanobacillus salinisoli TaxID=2678611 RepID=UPI001E501262|nr:hypothetical protein [Oceanobacillus salinisoli]
MFVSLGNFLYSLIHSTEPFEYISNWSRYDEITKDYRLIASSDKYNKSVVYPPGLVDILNQNNTDFVPYFMSEKIFSIDTDIITSMLSNSGVQILYDHSIMLDTNYTSYIKRFLSGIENSNLLEESTFKTLDILLKSNFNYDITFYLLENYMNIFSSGENTFTVSNAKHLALYENLYYVELFKNINQEQYVDYNKVEFTISKNEAKQNTDEIISLFYNGNLIANEVLSLFTNKHQSITLLLIGIWQIQFGSNSSPKNKMKKLFEYVINRVGIFYEREMVIAFRYFEDRKSVSMLNKINKGGKPITSKELLDKIGNIAWDFMVPRVMEFQINANKDSSHFIPLFLSHDKKLKELIGLFNIKGILMHRKTNEYIPFSDLDTTDFFDKKGLLDELETLKTVEIEAKRKKIREKNIETNFCSVIDEIRKLHEIL